MFGDLFTLFFSCVLINNILLIQYLGNCPFLGTSKKMETAVGMAMAVVFVLVLAGIITWIVEWYVLAPFDLRYLRTIAFILVIAALVQFVEMFLKKSIPALYTGLGIFLPLITTNCAVLGVALINLERQHGLLESLVFGAAAAAGFGLALLAFAGLRERLDAGDVPVAFRGTPIALVTAGLMALAFMGFSGLAGR
jgi:Na+-translocating ferredoxin:NAD+ oxidoreductase subunit A